MDNSCSCHVEMDSGGDNAISWIMMHCVLKNMKKRKTGNQQHSTKERLKYQGWAQISQTTVNTPVHSVDVRWAQWHIRFCFSASRILKSTKSQSVMTGFSKMTCPLCNRCCFCILKFVLLIYLQILQFGTQAQLAESYLLIFTWYTVYLNISITRCYL